LLLVSYNFLLWTFSVCKTERQKWFLYPIWGPSSCYCAGWSDLSHSSEVVVIMSREYWENDCCNVFLYLNYFLRNRGFDCKKYILCQNIITHIFNCYFQDSRTVIYQHCHVVVKHICPQQIPHGMPRNWTQSSIMRTWYLNAWAVAQTDICMSLQW
jgi:hypothetical protein